MIDPLSSVLQQSGINPAIMKSSFLPQQSYALPQAEIVQAPQIPVSKSSMLPGYMRQTIQPAQQAGGSNPVQDASGLSQDDYFKRLRQIESGGNPNAYNSSGHAGLYQFSKSTASPYLKKIGANWNTFRKDPQLQDQVAKMWTNDLDATLKSNGLPVTNRNRWFLHNLGPGGGVNLLKGRYDKINPTHITSNLPAKYGTTAQDYLNYWSKKWA